MRVMGRLSRGGPAGSPLVTEVEQALTAMKAGWTISAVLHAGVLAWGLSISAKPLDKPRRSRCRVDIIFGFGLLADHKGTKNAPKAEAPKQLVRESRRAKPPAEQSASKVVDNKPRSWRPPTKSPNRRRPSRVKRSSRKPPTPQPQPKPH